MLNLLIKRHLKLNILGIKFSFKIPKNIVIRSLYKYIDNNANLLNIKNIYILLTTSGEIYILLLLLINVLNKKQISEILFIGTKCYHIDIIKMFIPDANCIFCPEAISLIEDKEYKTTYNNKYYYKYLTNSFLKELFSIWQHNKQIHYIELIKNFIKVKINIYNNKLIPYFSQELHTDLQKKINYINLNINKFIFIAPEAQTCNSISNEFYIKLFEKLKMIGFDIFINTANGINKFNYGKTINLSYSEAILLAKYSHGIVALRSGICEILSLFKNKPMAILYSNLNCNNNQIETDRVLSTYTLKKYPFINENLTEYNIDHYSVDELVNNIVAQFN